jgi:hypothetical protein
VLHAASIDELRCRLVVGAANDVLAERSCAELLAHGASSMSPISCPMPVASCRSTPNGPDGMPDRLDLALAAIGRRTFDLFDEAAATRALPLHVAEQWASARLGRTVTIPD